MVLYDAYSARGRRGKSFSRHLLEAGVPDIDDQAGREGARRDLTLTRTRRNFRDFDGGTLSACDLALPMCFSCVRSSLRFWYHYDTIYTEDTCGYLRDKEGYEAAADELRRQVERPVMITRTLTTMSPEQSMQLIQRYKTGRVSSAGCPDQVTRAFA